MSEVVTAEQIEALQTDGFVVVDDLLTDAELDTFEPLVTAAVAYRSAGDERTLEDLKRHADTERPRPDRTKLQTSRKTGSVIRPGEGGLTGILSACRS